MGKASSPVRVKSNPEVRLYLQGDVIVTTEKEKLPIDSLVEKWTCTKPTDLRKVKLKDIGYASDLEVEKFSRKWIYLDEDIVPFNRNTWEALLVR